MVYKHRAQNVTWLKRDTLKRDMPLFFIAAPETLAMVLDDATTNEKIVHPGEYEIFVPDSTGSNVALTRTVKVVE